MGIKIINDWLWMTLSLLICINAFHCKSHRPVHVI